jgi:hypothetical protein
MPECSLWNTSGEGRLTAQEGTTRWAVLLMTTTENLFMDQWNRPHTRRFEAAVDDELEWDPKRQRELEAKRRERFDAALDCGLEESFPGSDPVSVVQPSPSFRDKAEP